ncbi:hypothetical protein PC119_g11835 [Phytophthora cactorum]|nr:hypothetical protein PC119_g11835 [Phytophthora cactorum]KAG3082355.1 hypothetical protein PC122_g10978 [Phytophthora cactorum]
MCLLSSARHRHTKPVVFANLKMKTAIDINAKMLVVLTETGNTARLVAKYRPEMPVLVLTALEQTAR